MKSMNNIYRFAFILAIWMVLVPVLPAMAEEGTAAGQEKTVEVSLGGQIVDGADGRGEARFQEFKDEPEGAVLDFARVNLTPEGTNNLFTFTAIDAGQDDQKIYANFWMPGTFSIGAAYTESLRHYSTGSKTLFSGIGSNNLTIPNSFRQGAEDYAGAPTNPFASPELIAYMRHALQSATEIDLGFQRKDLKGGLNYAFGPGFSLNLNGRNEKRDGTRALGFGTYIRRQALANTPGTGAGQFWRETVEARGVELIEPIDYSTTEFGATLNWARNGNSASAGLFVSDFNNDNTALFFDNPFEGGPGRASAITFDPKAEQEPGSPNGNNNLRGLVDRSSMQLAPNNEYSRLFGTLSLKLPVQSRLNATVAFGTFEQNDKFQPYAVNPFVVYSGKFGEPGAVLAKDAPLPQASLEGEMKTTQVDVKLTSRPLAALNLRAGVRLYELEDNRPSLLFPGYSSSGDAFFRAGIGQKDAAGNRILFNEVGGYSRQRINVGAAYRIGRITLDGEIMNTEMDYDARQVEGTSENSYKATVRIPVLEGNLNAFYQIADRDYEGDWHVGLETSGVRAYDVWARERDQFGIDFETGIGENVAVNAGITSWKDEYPGAVKGFAYGWGLQDSSNTSIFAGAHFSHGKMSFGATAGYDTYDFNSLQVTKTSLTTDYNPVNRWSRESSDNVYWLGLEADIPLGEKVKWATGVDFQRFSGEWETTNLGAPDVNSAIAYDYPSFSDRTLSARTSFLWDLTDRFAVELRYLYEPYRLNDPLVGIMSPYMQGTLKETASNPNDIRDSNVSRFLFLDSRYSDYDAQVATLLLRYSF